MTILFKNSKKVLSFAVAFAIIAMSLFTGVGFKAYADSGTLSNCATRETIYWDGSVATGIATGTGTKDDPYVIKTAAELAWLVQQRAEVTTDKYYEIDETIGAIVLQSADKAEAIKALDSAAATKAYFEAGSFTAWKTTSWEVACFAGHFDGNGATIYGMYATSAYNAALFCTVDGGAAFVNLAIKNSYLTSSADYYQVGALIGTSSNVGYGAKRDGIVWVKDVVIANNYLYNGCLPAQTIRSGVVIGNVQEAIQVENVLVYGNDATYGRESEIYNMPAIGYCSNGIQVAASHYDGLEIKSQVVDENTLYYNQVKNSIILGADVMNTRVKRGYRRSDPGVFSNVYTDGASGEIQYADGSYTYTEEQIKTITVADLATAELGDAWINTDSYPVLRASHSDITVVDNGDGTHTESCSCGFVSSIPHIYGDDNICNICNNICNHNGGTEFIEKSAATCTAAAKGDYKCLVCNIILEENVYNGEPLGHDLQLVVGTSADCENTGLKDYYDCSRCDMVFEDAAAEKSIDNLSEWIVTDALGHISTTDDNGIVYSVHDGMHYKICSRDGCDTEFDGEAHINGEYIADDKNGHTRICDVCGVETVSLNEHTFDENSTCTYCGWICNKHTADDAVIENVVNATHLVNGSYQEVVYCSICDFELSRTTKSIIAEGHIYDNACDASCNICGDIRVPSDHIYTIPAMLFVTYVMRAER